MTALITLSCMPSQLRAETKENASTALAIKQVASPGNNEGEITDRATEVTTTTAVKSEEEARADAQLTRLVKSRQWIYPHYPLQKRKN